MGVDEALAWRWRLRTTRSLAGRETPSWPRWWWGSSDSPGGSGASSSSAWTLDPQVSSGLTPRLLPASLSLTLTLAIPLKLPSSSQTHPLALLYFLRCTDHFEHTTSSTHLLAVSLPANVSCMRAGFFSPNRYCSLLYEWINEWTKLNPHKFKRKKNTRNKTFNMLWEWYYEWPFFFYFPNFL